MAVTEPYTAETIQVLRGLEGVRRRAGMYVGNTEDGSGMHHMFFEVLGNAIDEHLRGFVRNIRIDIDGDQMSVEDDGRGIPLDLIEQVFTKLHAGPAPQPHVHLTRGFWGVGVPVATALSRELSATVWRDGHEHVQRYERGEPITPLEVRGETRRTGTRVAFRPDFTIFTKHAWDVPMIARRCQQLAGILPGLAIAVNGTTYRYNTLIEYTRELAACDVIEPFHVCANQDEVGIELVLAWAQRGERQCFVNCNPCEGGVQIAAMNGAIRNVLRARIPGVSMSRVERRLVVILHVSLRDPKFGNPSRDWLMNEEVAKAVRDVVERELARHFEENPALLDQMLIDLQRKQKAATGRLRPRKRRAVSS
jgi:DNA gyrase subunit B